MLTGIFGLEIARLCYPSNPCPCYREDLAAKIILKATHLSLSVRIRVTCFRMACEVD